MVSKEMYSKILFRLFQYRMVVVILLVPLIISAKEIESVEVVNEMFNPNKKDVQLVGKPVLYDNGVLFTFYGEEGDQVFLSGSFNDWKKKIPMQQGKHGIYYHFLTSALSKGRYTYRYFVNGLWLNDQEQSHYQLDRNGVRISYFYLPRNILFTVVKSPEKLGDNQYRFYLKNEGYQKVSFISDLNQWNPDTKPMQLVDGYWYIDLNVPVGRLHYAFWVDGKKMFDPLNIFRATTDFGYVVNSIVLN